MNRVMVCALVVLAAIPADSEIRRILSERIKGFEDQVSITVGVIGPQGRRVVSAGSLGTSTRQPAAADTIYEIGSISKVFTALLLADMVERHEVALDDPVAKFLPPDVKFPSRGGREITLADLSTHRSGLPRMPANFDPATQLDPYVDYPVERLYAFLSAHQLRRDIDSEFEYSNLGVGLLGHALARKAGMSYEALLRRRVLDPLGMSSTGIGLGPAMRQREAQPHSSMFLLAPTPAWAFTDAFAGAGSLRSSAADMLTFLAAAIGYTSTPLTPAFARMLTIRRDAVPAYKIALGWRVEQSNGAEMIWTGGATYGSRAFAGYDPASRVGVVVIANYNGGSGIDDIGRHLLNARNELDIGSGVRPRTRTASNVPEQLLDAYAGHYQFADRQIWSVRRDGKRFFLKKPNEAELEIFPEGDFDKGNDDFFAASLDAMFTFDFDLSSPGRATRLTFTWGFFDPRTAKRVE